MDLRPGLIPAHAGSTWPPLASSARIGAHPRSRGVDPRPGVWTGRACGSSPLTRGRPNGGQEVEANTRLIPAHAGSTADPRSTAGGWPAHPRSRGVDKSPLRLHALGTGSSPLTRGRPKPGTESAGSSGLIPAHAGSTPGTTQKMAERPAHPRSRGVDLRPVSETARIVGSSPLTRGRPAPDGARILALRLIPAHAGSTAAPWQRCAGVGGSSPLTRGRRGHHLDPTAEVGLIPAHAGSTFIKVFRGQARRAHPRSRGVDPRRGRGRNSTAGSSPLTRGRLHRSTQMSTLIRLIPAHAGSTRGPIFSPIPDRAHPRSRGVDSARLPRCWGARGSSPLTRGRHRRRPGPGRDRGLIPAHAGST